jgi:hypothetical protein
MNVYSGTHFDTGSSQEASLSATSEAMAAETKALEQEPEHRKFKRPLQGQALGEPDTTAWSGPCAPIHSLKRHLEPRPDTSRAASHAQAPRFTRGLRPSAGRA